MVQFFSSFFEVFSSMKFVWSIDNIIGAMFFGSLIIAFPVCFFVRLVNGFRSVGGYL